MCTCMVYIIWEYVYIYKHADTDTDTDTEIDTDTDGRHRHTQTDIVHIERQRKETARGTEGARMGERGAASEKVTTRTRGRASLCERERESTIEAERGGEGGAIQHPKEPKRPDS